MKKTILAAMTVAAFSVAGWAGTLEQTAISGNSSLGIAGMPEQMSTQSPQQFDPAALNICTSESAFVMSNCLAIIRNGTFNSEALKLCDTCGSSIATNECLSIIKNGSFEGAALSVCARNRSALAMNLCLGIIKDGTFDLEALKACDGYADARATNQCLSAIRGPKNVATNR